MTTFIERLRQAATYAGVGDKQADIAGALGVKRQTVNRWFVIGGEPDTHLMFHISSTFGVDPKWLKSGEGEMLPEPSGELPADERELLRNYRSATSKVREVIRTMVRTARKVAVVVVALIIPPFQAPPAEASLLHKQNSSVIHIVRRWLLMMVHKVRLLTLSSPTVQPEYA